MLYILRGLPGAGKTTLAKHLASVVPNTVEICADDCWDYDYTTDPRGFTSEGVKAAHKLCRHKVTQAMAQGKNVVLHNTSTTEREFAPYLGLATYYGYKVVSLIVENLHNGKSVHNVPADKLEAMRERFEVKL